MIINDSVMADQRGQAARGRDDLRQVHAVVVAHKLQGRCLYSSDAAVHGLPRAYGGFGLFVRLTYTSSIGVHLSSSVITTFQPHRTSGAL